MERSFWIANKSTIRGAVFLLVFCTLLSYTISTYGLGFSGLDILLYILYLIIIIQSNKIGKYLIAGFNQKSIFFYLIIVICASVFFSNYVVSFSWGIIGIILSSLIPFSMLVFDRMMFTRLQILKLLKYISRIGFLLILFIYIEHFIWKVGNQLYFLRGVHSLFKDGGLAATFINITALCSLTLYRLERAKVWIYLIVLCGVTLLLLLYLKSIFLFILILIFYIRINTKNIGRFVIIFILGGVIIMRFLSFFPAVNSKIILYQDIYLESATKDEIPRNALYYVAFRLAVNRFPLGAGAGTYGSYPVLKTYNKVYDDYGLSSIYGLERPQKGTETFLLDAYWSSILGELGFLGTALFLLSFFIPFRKVFRLRLKGETAIMRYFVLSIALILFVASFALAIPSQINIILILCVLCQGIANYIKYNDIRDKMIK